MKVQANISLCVMPKTALWTLIKCSAQTWDRLETTSKREALANKLEFLNNLQMFWNEAIGGLASDSTILAIFNSAETHKKLTFDCNNNWDDNMLRLKKLFGPNTKVTKVKRDYLCNIIQIGGWGESVTNLKRWGG